MYIPLQYQISEYDCVPTSFINAVSCLFRRHEIPPMVIRYIYMYSLDTVGKNSRLGIAGTSKYAVRLLGSWLNSYKLKKFSAKTEFLEGEEVHFARSGRILNCLEDEGVALVKIYLYSRESHYLLLLSCEEDWVFCFDPYYRKAIRGLDGKVEMLKTNDVRSPNLKINRRWLDRQDPRDRFCSGPVKTREGLLMWRDR